MIIERFQKVVEILTKNDRGGFTVWTSVLYPHQWNWDSASTAIGITTYNKIRAWQELIILIRTLLALVRDSSNLKFTNN
tara:strand:+ start:247 stop:483 length:237 start_codon:yes stop_codon:yes gene_type:complete